jgi:hypothetical protein
VSIEAGPRTAVPLYDAPGAIDELMLSVYEGPLDPGRVAGTFLSDEDLRARGYDRASSTVRGEWRFERWLRSSLSRARRGTAAGSDSPSRGSA